MNGVSCGTVNLTRQSFKNFDSKSMVGESETAVTSKYFVDLIQEKPIRFGYSDGKGKALFASKKFTTGQPIFSEIPWVAMQHRSNQRLVQGCENCFAVCGSIEDQLAHILDVGVDAIPTIPRFVKSEIDASQPPKGIQLCPCGAVYCSNECRVAAWERYHCLLCPANPDSPMQEFFLHSIGSDVSLCQRMTKNETSNETSIYVFPTETNEIFLLAAQVICTTCVNYARTGSIEESRKPVDMFCKLPWWEVGVRFGSELNKCKVVSVNATLEEGQTIEDYCGIFKELLAHTVELFVEGLRFNTHHLILHGNHPDSESNFMSTVDFENVISDCEANGILSLDFFAKVVGMFEMNNISLEIRHPFSLVAELYQESDVPEIQTWFESVSATIQAKIKLENGADDEDYSEEKWDYPDLEGTALFSLICMMNHSCDPNVAVSYEYGVATVVAVREISDCDELCISYIDTDQDFYARKAELRCGIIPTMKYSKYLYSEYQFECQCQKCESERL
ncbi:Aste57867_22554 [Aphanomyces stellatus]|uniref:Aste57867_22554 protein n=1 Tax=Aphanomyces stellatus TaxID=120398 RepID=A0A485LKK4_9STRA|nr:hypothetical protein As57867_022484 [Aphanomyces stellatus]VFT99213.1 Aste57867_22554 [Aphanomyces stellatus]